MRSFVEVDGILMQRLQVFFVAIGVCCDRLCHRLLDGRYGRPLVPAPVTAPVLLMQRVLLTFIRACQAGMVHVQMLDAKPQVIHAACSA